MNDRHKFRVWDCEREKYLRSDTFGIINGNVCIWNPFKSEKGHAYFDPELGKRIIIEQCTGLKDKNGKLIFEGDFVYLWLRKMPIVFQNGGFGYIEPITGFIPFSNHPHLELIKKEIEIIGNIHDEVKK